MTNSRAKGKRGELQVAELLRQHGIPARRGQQFSGGPGSPDVVHALDPIIHIECKFASKLLLDDWYDQAVVDAQYRVAAVLHRGTVRGGPWRATTSLAELGRLCHVPDFEALAVETEADAADRLARHSPLRARFVLANALRFESEFAASQELGIDGLVPVLAHARKEHDAIWMASLLATDFLEVAVQYAMEEFDWFPTLDTNGFEGDLERRYRQHWESQRTKLASSMPLFVEVA